MWGGFQVLPQHHRRLQGQVGALLRGLAFKVLASFWVQDFRVSGFRVWRVWGLGYRVWDLGFRVWCLGFGFRVWCLGFRVWGLVFLFQGLGLGFGVGVSCLGCRVLEIFRV